MTINIIDPHVHLFDLQRGQYEWLNSLKPHQKSKIAKNFCLQDLKLKGDLSLAGFVHIEAGFNNAKPSLEILNIEKQLDVQGTCTDFSKPLLAKTAGSVDLRLEYADFIKLLDAQRACASCIGVRHILNEDAIEVLRHVNTLQNLRYLASLGLIFELHMPLHNAQTISALVELVAQVPDLKLVVNHAGFAPINKSNNKAQNLSYEVNTYHQWQEHTKTLSQFANVSLKCSGWEMLDETYSFSTISPCIEHLVQTFGTKRLMFASNFPLVLYCVSYQQYWENMVKLATNIGIAPEQVCFENARRIYRF
jgi:predicted TIM-barrel fold metal-dependent hydrolase